MPRHYQIGPIVLDGDDPALGDALVDAYAKKLRPICLCRTPGIPMYLARIGEQLVLKRMPLSGAEHDTACPSYEPPYELSGLGSLIGNAIKINVEDGTAALKLDFSLNKRGARSASSETEPGETAVRNDAKKLSLRALLHYLWHESGLTEWTAHWAGKRHWYQVRSHLLDAANAMTIKGGMLAERLFIPEPFRVEHKQDIEQRREEALAGIRTKHTGPRTLMLMIGEVKEFSAVRGGQRIIVKHMPGFLLTLEDGAFRRLQSRYAVEFDLWMSCETAHLMMIASFSINLSGIARVEEIALASLSEQWIPIENAYEQRLVERLARLSMKSIKGLRFNLPSTEPMASAMLPSRCPKPAALYIVPPNAKNGFEEALAEMISARPDVEPWIWRVADGDIPALPI